MTVQVEVAQKNIRYESNLGKTMEQNGLTTLS